MQAFARMEACIQEVKTWLCDNGLVMNENKSEAIVIRSPSLRTPITFSRINICGQFVDTSAFIRDLGFAIDTHLSMASQVSNICRSAYYHLSRIAKIRNSLTTGVCKSLIHGLVISRLDYGAGPTLWNKLPANIRGNGNLRLLLKLKAHGIGDSITDWIEQWLTDRRQRVVVDGEVSNWKSVLSGVPQGSVLGPILFLIYINDLDDSITSNVLKFADDTKLFRKVNTDGDKQHLQNDLDRLVKWSEKWQMLFNFGKCKCLHTGHRNLNVNYRMGDTVLGTTVKEKDLGVTISADMKVSEQCGIAASKGNQILGLIRRNITYKGKKLIIPLYKAIVRPHLEYCIQAWRPYRKKDIDTLERIQRRATKMIPELRDLSYEERLKECGLTTLETRRLRGDQIEVFKILNGYENIDRNMFFSLKKDSRTRGHEVKLVKDQCRLDIRKHSFSQRTINEWNKLSTDCVTASSVNMFKNKVDTYLRRAGYK